MHTTRLFGALALCAALSLPAMAKNKKQNATDGAKQRIEQLEQEGAEAFSRGDRNWFDKYETPGFVLVDGDGKVWTRAQQVDDVKNFKAKTQISNLQVSVDGDAAVAVYTNTLTGTHAGQDISGKSVESDFWVKRGGVWKMLGSQLTNLH